MKKKRIKNTLTEKELNMIYKRYNIQSSMDPITNEKDFYKALSSTLTFNKKEEFYYSHSSSKMEGIKNA